MLVLSALLVSVSAGCLVFWFMERREIQKTISLRLGGAVPLPAAAPVLRPAGKSLLRDPKEKEITLENLGTDKMAKSLYLAGIRSTRALRTFHLLLKLSAAVPLVMAAGHLATGTLDFRRATGTILIGAVLFGYVQLVITLAKNKRQRMILKSLPQLLDLLVVCVEAGLNFSAAMERILREADPKDPLTKEFSVMYHEFLGGLSLEKACERMDKRCEVPDLSLLLSSIVQSDQMGASLGNTLRVQAKEIRDKYRQRVRARALKIPIKILFPMLPIFLAFMLMNLGIIGYQMNTVLGQKNVESAQRSIVR